MSDKNYYETLGLTKEADEMVIKAAYKVLAQKYHPDKSNSE
jgi:DnaJ-class molecular chaperone